MRGISGPPATDHGAPDVFSCRSGGASTAVYMGDGAQVDPELLPAPTLNNTPKRDAVNRSPADEGCRASVFQYGLHEVRAAGLEGSMRIVEVQHIGTGMIHTSKPIVRLGSNGVSRLADEAHPGIIEPMVAPRLHIIVALGRTIQVGNGHLH
jgi:hypothetical protein